MIIIILILFLLFIFFENFEDIECVEARQYCSSTDCFCCSGIKPACTLDINKKKICQCLI